MGGLLYSSKGNGNTSGRGLGSKIENLEQYACQGQISRVSRATVAGQRATTPPDLESLESLWTISVVGRTAGLFSRNELGSINSNLE